jgi:hypothetical protein
MRDLDDSEDRSRRRWLKLLGPVATVAIFAIRVYEALNGSHWQV